MKSKLTVPKRRYARAFAPDLSAGMNASSDDGILPFGLGALALNVSVKSGVLKNGYGIEQTQISAQYGKVYLYKIYDEQTGEKEYLLAYDESGKIYSISADGNGQAVEITGVTFSKPPLGVNYRLFGEDVYLLCGEEGMAVVHPDLKAENIPSAPSITGITMHNERMFVTVGGRRNAVWFSDDLNPTNWNPELDEGGFIEMEGERGRLINAVSFGGYVYVFREYGISRITAYGDQSEFGVVNLFVSSGKIYADTVCVCGDRILFLSGSGLYSFDGFSTVRIAANLDGFILPDDSAAACYCDGKYFLSATVNEPRGNALIVIDPRSKDMSVNCGLNITAFSPVTESGGERLLVKADNQYLGEVKSGADVFGTAPERIWQSGFTDMNYPDRKKIVTELYLDSKYDCTVTVTTERGVKKVNCKGKNGSQRLRINLMGTKIRVRVSAVGNMDLGRIAVKYCLV